MDFLKNLRKSKPNEEQLGSPTDSSRVVNSGENFKKRLLRNDRGRTVLKNNLGERFHHLVNQPEQQIFLSRILKPFFTTADVVKIDDKWYSQEPPLEKIQKKTSEQEVLVEIQMIGVLVNDFDRRLGHNCTYKNDKIVYYDFSGAGRLFFIDEGDWSKFEDYLLQHGDIIPYVREKAGNMIHYWNSDAGKSQLKAAYDGVESKIDIFYVAGSASSLYTAEDVRKTLLSRADRILRLSDRVENSIKRTRDL